MDSDSREAPDLWQYFRAAHRPPGWWEAWKRFCTSRWLPRVYWLLVWELAIGGVILLWQDSPVYVFITIPAVGLLLWHEKFHRPTP